MLNNICFNSLEYESLSGNLLIETSDHLIQFLILQGFVKGSSLPETNLFKRDFSNFNEREFEEVVFSIDWENICSLEKNNPNLSCNNLYNLSIG